jgi:hypothetical protein
MSARLSGVDDPRVVRAAETPAAARIKIFACAIHSVCQLDDKITGVKCCDNCVDRKTPP